MKGINLHLPAFKESLLESHQHANLFKSNCNRVESEFERILMYIFKSSANNRYLQMRVLPRSLMKMLKSSGPSTDPCGTPEGGENVIYNRQKQLEDVFPRDMT